MTIEKQQDSLTPRIVSAVGSASGKSTAEAAGAAIAAVVGGTGRSSKVDRELAAIHSKNGAKGARKRHEPMTKLKQWAIEKYRAGKWPNANAAAYELKEEIAAYGRTINAILSPANAQATIADWFRKANRSS